MATQDPQTLVRRFFEELCNARQLAVADELFAVDHRYHDPSSPGIAPGPAGMRQLLATYHDAFPDAHWTVEEMLTAGDTVVTRWIAQGTNDAELLGMPPTGKAVSVPGIWIHRVQDGQIVQSWNVWDTLGMLQQMEIVPRLGAA